MPSDAPATADWKDKVGRSVVFTYHHGQEDFGVVTSVNDRYVFVRFAGSIQGQACDPTQLTLV